MSIFVANLKHLYQRRGAWFGYLMILCMVPMALIGLIHDRYLGFLLVSFWAGVFAGNMQKDVLMKPFSFCLPGHRRIPRPFIFWIGGVVNLILGCVFLMYPGLDFPYVLMLMIILAGGFVGMILYFYGVCCTLFELRMLLGGILPWLALGAIILFRWDKVVQNMIITRPIPTILASGLGCVWFWRLFGRDTLARRHCGKLVFDDFNTSLKAQKYRQTQADRNLTAAKAEFFERLHEFFLRRMNRYEFLGKGRHVWGNLYMVFGRGFGTWQMKHVLASCALIFFLVLFFGFAGKGEGINVLFVILALGGLSLDLLPYRSMLFPAGRAEKYFSTLVLAVFITFLTGVLTLALIGISVLLETLLPEFGYKADLLSYQGMDIGLFYIFLLVIPIALSCAIAFPRNMIVKIIFVVVLMQGWIISAGMCEQSLMDMIGLAGVLGLVALCWIGFLIILHYVCMRRSLIGQGR
ncbi:MAG: hypothetical protein ACYSR9_12945 [Planctomycetota bacterium]|jgi:hypothetical protein